MKKINQNIKEEEKEQKRRKGMPYRWQKRGSRKIKKENNQQNDEKAKKQKGKVESL